MKKSQLRNIIKESIKGLMNEQSGSAAPCGSNNNGQGGDFTHPGAMQAVMAGGSNPQLGDHGINQNFVNNMSGKSAAFYNTRRLAVMQKTIDIAGVQSHPGNVLLCRGWNPMWQAALILKRKYIENCSANIGTANAC